MNTKILFTKALFLSCLMVALSFAFSSCSDEDEMLQAGYGYAQFKLFKSASYAGVSRAGTNELEYLRDAQKMKIILLGKDGDEINQTVNLEAMGSDSELGLRSEKLQLMAGQYTVVGFYLYKASGQELKMILSGEPEEKTVITVVDGGLCVQDIKVKTIERGNVKFSLIKDFINTRAVKDEIIFDQIRYAEIVVQDQFTKVTYSLKKFKVAYEEKIKDGKTYAIATSDTTFSLKAGAYKVIACKLFDRYNNTAGSNSKNNEIFTVADNKITDVDAYVSIDANSDRIKDYMALREIFVALDGDNWSYVGQTYPVGSKWDFNKDIDLWGNQPGVGLNESGRVAAIDIGAFGCRGHVPDAIGQLTEMSALTLGSHADKLGSNMLEQWKPNMTEEQKKKMQADFYNKFLKKDLRATFSEPLRKGFEMQNKPVETPNTVLTRAGISTRDVSPGNYTNGITGVSKEINKLTKLRQLYIANGKFSDFDPGTDFSGMSDLVDVELYNCQSMKELPEALFTMPNLEMLILASNPHIASDKMEQGLVKLANGASKEKLQILYLSNNSLEVLPADMKNFIKLGKLDCTNNKIKKLYPFGKAINLVQASFANNQIEEVPRDEEGYFCGYEDVESLSFAYNKIKIFPNIFNSESIFVMSSVDFSYNQITGFQDGDDFKGLNVTTLSLSGNKLTTFPAILFAKNSQISQLALSANAMTEFPDGSLNKGTKTHFLESLDLTFNKLSSLPKEVSAATLPWLYGVDMSNNCFSKFPTGPLNVDHLTVFGLRNQRDAKGNRTLREWPTGIYLCPSLRALYLGGNDLRKIDDTISSRIYLFEIKDNPNIVIDMSDICPYIKAGYYQLIYDTTQDIRGCDYLGIE